MKRYVVNGENVVDFRSMCDALGRSVRAPNNYFGQDLQTFDDCFFGHIEFETPCEFIWTHSSQSAAALNSTLLVDYCTQVLKSSEIRLPENAEGKMWAVNTLARALSGDRTMFDEVIEGIHSVTQRSSNRRIVTLTLE